jgi:hypothetical protein
MFHKWRIKAKKKDELGFIKNIKLLLLERCHEETKETRRKYPQYIHLREDLYSNYRKNSEFYNKKTWKPNFKRSEQILTGM